LCRPVKRVATTRHLCRGFFRAVVISERVTRWLSPNLGRKSPRHTNHAVATSLEYDEYWWDPEEGQLSRTVWEMGSSVDYNGDGEVNGAGAGTPSFLQVLKNKVCSALPQGRTFGVSGGIGGIGGQTGTLELVMNYDSGQVSGFASGGFQFGWNGGAQGSVFTGYISGPLGGDNGGYQGGFTTASLSVPVPAPGLSAVGSVSKSGNGVKSVTGGVGGSLLGRYGLTVSKTDYTKPLQLGKYWAFSNPNDLLFFIAHQVCK
jgi:hypothetical protein